MGLAKLKSFRTGFLIVLGTITWNSVVSWWSNWLTLALLIVDVMCVLITFAATKQKKPAESAADLNK